MMPSSVASLVHASPLLRRSTYVKLPRKPRTVFRGETLNLHLRKLVERMRIELTARTLQMSVASLVHAAP